MHCPPAFPRWRLPITRHSFFLLSGVGDPPGSLGVDAASAVSGQRFVIRSEHGLVVAGVSLWQVQPKPCGRLPPK